MPFPWTLQVSLVSSHESKNHEGLYSKEHGRGKYAAEEFPKQLKVLRFSLSRLNTSLNVKLEISRPFDGMVVLVSSPCA